jgi:hypothetical protein
MTEETITGTFKVLSPPFNVKENPESNQQPQIDLQKLLEETLNSPPPLSKCVFCDNKPLDNSFYVIYRDMLSLKAQVTKSIASEDVTIYFSVFSQ